MSGISSTSGISLDAYLRTAQRSESGTVRLAKGKPDELVNKGTLGNKLATAWQGVARFLHIMRPDPTRAERQQRALDGFKASLASRFGRDAADAALAEAGLAAPAAKLTGRAIRVATDLAENGRQRKSAAVALAISQWLPPERGAQPSPVFAHIAGRIASPCDPAALSGEVRAEYEQRFREKVAMQSQLGRRPMDHKEMKALAKQVLQHVVALESQGLLGETRAAIETYRRAWRNVVASVAANMPPAELMPMIGRLLGTMNDVARLEYGGEFGGPDVQEANELGATLALRVLYASTRQQAARLQERALSDSGALKSICAAAWNEIRSQGDNDEERLLFHGRVYGVGIALVNALDGVMGSRTATGETDIVSFDDAKGLSPAHRRAGVEALAQLRAKLLGPGPMPADERGS